MRDETWVKGMAELVVSFPAPDQDPEVLRARGAVYRRELGSLTDDAWLYAVREAIRNETWFPTVAQLLDYAGRAPVAAPKAALPDDTRTPEEKRADAKRLIGVLRDAIGEEAPPEGGDGFARAIPTKPVVATDERMEMLRAQAREIGGATATAVEEIEGRG